MRLRSQVQDALYLNWALPASALPPPPAPLRYQTLTDSGNGDDGGTGGTGAAREVAFASALLFRHRGVHLPHLPFVRFTYPQLNLRLYTLDADRVPSVLFVDMLMPWWVGPAVRMVAKSPTSAARFTYPRPSADPAEGEWSWRVEQPWNGGGASALQVTARRGSGLAMTGVPGGAAAPGGAGGGGNTSVGTWRETVRFFRERPRGYVVTAGRLRRVETEHPPVEVWPMAVDVEDDSLLERVLPLGGGGGGDGDGTGGGPGGGAAWPALHSAWLCPQIPFVFDLAVVPHAERERDLDATLPQPASTRSTCARDAHSCGTYSPGAARRSCTRAAL